MFGTRLLNVHQVFLEDACEEIHKQSEKKFELTWEDITKLPKSEYLGQDESKGK